LEISLFSYRKKESNSHHCAIFAPTKEQVPRASGKASSVQEGITSKAKSITKDSKAIGRTTGLFRHHLRSLGQGSIGCNRGLPFYIPLPEERLWT